MMHPVNDHKNVATRQMIKIIGSELRRKKLSFHPNPSHILRGTSVFENWQWVFSFRLGFRLLLFCVLFLFVIFCDDTSFKMRILLYYKCIIQL